MESVYIGNIEQVNLQKRGQKMNAVCIRLLDRIETSDEYEAGMPVIFVGELQSTYPNPLTDYESRLAGYEAYVMDWLPYRGSSSWQYALYMKNYLGVSIETASDYANLYNQIMNLDWFRNMEVFPSWNCTKKYEGVLVVKLS